jgi:hypothetical protein
MAVSCGMIGFVIRGNLKRIIAWFRWIRRHDLNNVWIGILIIQMGKETLKGNDGGVVVLIDQTGGSVH